MGIGDDELKKHFLAHSENLSTEEMVNRGIIKKSTMRDYCIVWAHTELIKRSELSSKIVEDLSKKFGVCKRTISRIITEKRRYV